MLTDRLMCCCVVVQLQRLFDVNSTTCAVTELTAPDERQCRAFFEDLLKVDAWLGITSEWQHDAASHFIHLISGRGGGILRSVFERPEVRRLNPLPSLSAIPQPET